MFGEDDSESPRRPSPFYSTSDLKPTQKPSTSTQNHSKPRTLNEFLEREMNGLSLDQGSWRNEIEPEFDSDGHIEYKLKILSPSPARFEKLTTQLKWRLLEGGGIALYEIGVLDDGTLIGLNSNQMEESLSNLSKMAKELNGYIEISHVIQLPEILIQTTSTSSQNRSLIHQVFKNHMGKSIQHHHSHNNSVGSERKDKGKQRKKKKKLKSKLSSYNLNNRSSHTKIIRIAPGDSAVSSDSETNSPKETLDNKTNTLINTLEISKLDTEEPLKRPKIKRWSREIDQRPSRQIERIGGYLDQICLLTPEERCMIKSNLRKEKKNERNKKLKNKETRKVIEEENGEGDVDGKDSNATKYVVEVKVLKCLDQFEDERFLDFGGFGN